MTVTLPGSLQMLLGLYAYLLPLLLYVLWSTLALWDLGRREDAAAAPVWIWTLAIFRRPRVGALGYLLFGGTRPAPRINLLALESGASYLNVLELVAY